MKIYTNDLVKGHSDVKVKCLTFGLYTQVSDSGPLGPLVLVKEPLIKKGSFKSGPILKREVKMKIAELLPLNMYPIISKPLLVEHVKLMYGYMRVKLSVFIHILL